MPADPNWSRWIFSSVSSYITGVANTAGIALLVEGVDERDDLFQASSDRAELRINGPWSQEVSQGVYRVWVDVNMLLTSMWGGPAKNAYVAEVNLGVFQNALDQPVGLYKYGTNPQDDQTQFGYLTARVGPQDSIRVLRFGQIDPTAHIRQYMLDARLFTYIYT